MGQKVATSQPEEPIGPRTNRNREQMNLSSGSALKQEHQLPLLAGNVHKGQTGELSETKVRLTNEAEPFKPLFPVDSFVLECKPQSHKGQMHFRKPLQVEKALGYYSCISCLMAEDGRHAN